MAEEKEEKAYEPDDGNVDIDVGDNEEEQEVEVSVSGVSSEETDVEDDEDSDEHQKYTAGVQKRIDRLTKKMREAERQREPNRLKLQQTERVRPLSPRSISPSLDPTSVDPFFRPVTSCSLHPTHTLPRCRSSSTRGAR